MRHDGQEGVGSPSWPSRARAERMVHVAGPPSPERLDVARYLRDAGYHVSLAPLLADVTRAVDGHHPANVVIFVGPAGAEALEFCVHVRSRPTPLLVIFTEVGPDDVVRWLDAGADDVMIAPVTQAEFLARVVVAMRYRDALAALATNDVLELRGLRIDLVGRTVALDGISIDLPAHEFQLLSALAQQVGTVLSTAFLVDRIWADGSGDGAARLRVCMTRLRRRLGAHPNAPVILAERGVGYALVLRASGV